MTDVTAMVAYAHDPPVAYKYTTGYDIEYVLAYVIVADASPLAGRDKEPFFRSTITRLLFNQARSHANKYMRLLMK